MTEAPPESSPPGPESPAPESPPDSVRELRAQYWRANLTILAALLIVWFVVSFGCGILWVDQLDAYRLPGTHFPLGFWFAQQGAIYTFVALIFVYVGLMSWLDRRFDVDERDEPEVE